MQPGKQTPKERQRRQQQDKAREKELLKKHQADKKLVIILAWLTGIVGFALYINTLGHGFVLDDYSIILENKSTQKGIAAWKEIFSTSYRHGYILIGDELYRPLSKAIFALFWEISPNDPFPGHLLNVILYGLTGFMLVITLHKLFGSVHLAFIASLLFITHPIHTEVVANIKSLDEILALLFNILALNFLYNYCTNRKATSLIATFAFFMLALFSKESSVTFLGVFALSGFFLFKDKMQNFLRASGALLAAFLIFMIARHNVVGAIVSLAPSAADNLLMSAPDKLHRFTGAVYIMGLYILKLIFPHPLAFDYSYNQLPVAGPGDWRFLLSLAFFAGVIIWCILNFRKRHPLVYGALFFFITASVSSNIFMMIGTSMGERLMYMPSMGFCITIAALLMKVFRFEDANSVSGLLRNNAKVYMPLALILVLFSVKTIARNPVWENNYTLYSNDVRLSPNSTRTHYYLGNLLIKDDFHKGKTSAQRDSLLRAGISELEKSVAIYPSFTDAWNQMGVAYWRLKDNENARRCYLQALNYNPNDPTVHNNLGTIYFETGSYAEAYQSFTKATSLKPDYADAWLNTGSVLGTQQSYQEAIAAFEKAVYYDPNNRSAWHFLGITWQALGNKQKADEAFAKAGR